MKKKKKLQFWGRICIKVFNLIILRFLNVVVVSSSAITVEHSINHVTKNHHHRIQTHKQRFLPNTNLRILILQKRFHVPINQTRNQNKQGRENPPAHPSTANQTQPDPNSLPPDPILRHGNHYSEAHNC